MGSHLSTKMTNIHLKAQLFSANTNDNFMDLCNNMRTTTGMGLVSLSSAEPRFLGLVMGLMGNNDV